MSNLKTVEDYQALNQFGQRVKSLRLQHNLKVGELARRAALTPRSILYFEEGTREPSTTSLFKLAAALGVSPVYLWEG